ncbi:MAG: response regulator transcription factor [Dehalococcoidia bacterium]|nr:Transcriptional regulatory protein TcrA [Chloroflexota bacterium]MBT9160612.1 Transcriptional regulatory protein TcrA [Chloroflexota bacterium]MBT9162824.1 Transcriptional regulatory protein TcrA [Chloroflexota bacterium]MBT9163355.1 Transcriptional regulatory protein TcrA [Chloroflexota bacterium]
MRILIIEDEIDLADILAQGLRRQGYAVDIASDGEQGCESAMVNDYDLLILDLNLPGMDGLEVCRRLRAGKPHLLILILTARNRPFDKITGLDLGADDYLVKPFDFGELVARIRALLRRDLRVRDTILQCGDLKLDPASRTVWHGDRRLELTRKEFGVLEYLMRHPGEVISQEELLEHVWDAEADPFSNTVRVHIHSLRRKLGDDQTPPKIIETIAGLGYRLVSSS